MQKIDFKNYPNTDSPINGTNLNTLQNNVEEAIDEVNKKLITEISFSDSLWFYGVQVGGDSFQVIIPVYTAMKRPTVNLNASVYSTSLGWKSLNYTMCRVFSTFIVLCFSAETELEQGKAYLTRMSGTITF